MSQAAADSLVTEGTELLLNEKYDDAVVRFDKATRLFPPHSLAWRRLGHALLRLGRAQEAARAFDQAIGLKPQSATALWGGAVAHAELGNKVVAQSYLKRSLAVQPAWLEMALGTPQLAGFLQVSARAADALQAAFGAFSTRTYRHERDATSGLEVARIHDQPRAGSWTFVTIGLSNRVWADERRPRIELILASTSEAEVGGQILANLAFHLGDAGCFPEPGVMVRDVVGALGAGVLSRRLPHVYVRVPRAWSALPLPLALGPPPITLAQVVPVSEAEYGLWQQHPGDLETAFTANQVDLADLNRA